MRAVPLLFVVLALIAGPALSAPRAVSPPSPGDQAGAVESLAGSRWTGVAVWEGGDRYEMTILFRPDGVLVYGYNGQTYDNGCWTQNDWLVFIDTNQNYALYVGRLSADGLIFSGEAYNRTGARGSFTFQRD